MKTLKDLLGTLDNKKIILISIAAVLFLLMDFNLLKMQLNGNKKLTAKIIKVKKDIDTLNQDLKKMEELKKRFEDSRGKTSTKLKKLLSEQELTFLLQYISGLAKQNDIQISQLKPARQSAAADFKKVGAGKQPASTAYSVSVDLICGYHDLGAFLNNLENGEIFIEAKSIKIIPQAQDVLKQKVNLNLMTYVKK
ncbi:MAG: type 4a pilus biogenesis protein PilO [Candidatus Omnitrophica bacterium]|nr:type 4a pilus biogenesis protein PilO [Candidatus Omnitrophota bacterium]